MKILSLLSIILAANIASANFSDYSGALEEYADTCDVELKSLKIEEIEESDSDFDYISEILQLNDGGQVGVTTVRREVRGEDRIEEEQYIDEVSCAEKKVNYNEMKVQCDLVDHPLYNKTIVYGDGEIHFERIDGKSTGIHHDGYNFVYSPTGISAIYHDGDDLLFYMDHMSVGDTTGVAVVQVPGWDDVNNQDVPTDDYIAVNCVMTPLK